MLETRRSIRVVPARAGLLGALLALVCAPAAAQTTRGPEAGAEAPGAHRAHADQRLEEIEELLAMAHFHTALALVQDTLEQLPAPPGDPGLAAQRAQLEVLGATAEVALGRPARARQHLVRALRADASLTLDVRDTSPKVVELLREARQRAAVEGSGS